MGYLIELKSQRFNGVCFRISKDGVMVDRAQDMAQARQKIRARLKQPEVV